MGPSATGNDYAIDAVELYVTDFTPVTPYKFVDDDCLKIGDSTTFHISLANNTDTVMTDITFQDIIPEGLVFDGGSVRIDGIYFPTYDPNVGFSIPDIIPAQVVDIAFDVTATHVPSGGVAKNTATVAYNAGLLVDLTPVSFSPESNECDVRIIDIQITKTADCSITAVGSVICFTVDVYNNSDVNYYDDGVGGIIFSDALAGNISYNAGSFNYKLLSSSDEPTFVEPNIDINNLMTYDNLEIPAWETVVVKFCVTVNSTF